MASVRALFRPVNARTFSTTARNNYAKLTVIGRLAGPPEAHASSTGREYLKYGLATSHGPRENERTSWWNVTSFPTSETQKNYLLGLPKGTLVHLEAEAEMQKYEVEGEGSRKSLNLIQRNIEVLGRPKDAQAASEAAEPMAAAA